MWKTIRQFLTPPTDVPGTIPRRRLLHILAVGFVPIAVLIALSFFALAIIEETSRFESLEYGVIMTIGSLLIFGLIILNKYRGDRLVGVVFTLMITGLLVFGDTPVELIDGRSMLLFLLPILVASVVVHPRFGFLVAAISSLINTVLWYINGRFEDIPLPNFPGMLTYFAFALVAWLATNSLERALSDLFKLNQELDKRVADRTRELYAALTAEHTETAKTQAIITSIADGVIVFNLDGRAIVVNPALPLLLGVESTQILDHSFEELAHEGVPDAQREGALRQLQSASLKGPSDALPFSRFQWRDKTLLVSFAPVRDQETEQMLGTVAVFHDFTREAELEAMKSGFVSMVSHELRTPLNAILGYADMLLEAVYEPLNDGQKSVVKRIFSNTNRQLSIVNDLLDRAQMEAGRLILRSAPFSPAALLDEMYDMMITIAQAKNLRLVTRLEADVPDTLYGDQQRLHQILVNLVNNAIKFTDNGVVGVRLHYPDAAHWALDVVDTGKGIAPEAQQLIFDPFRQVDGTATRSHKGVGLGLSIVRDLVSLMRGEIKVASVQGKGSTFTIVLPLEQESVKESTT